MDVTVRVIAVAIATIYVAEKEEVILVKRPTESDGGVAERGRGRGWEERSSNDLRDPETLPR